MTALTAVTDMDLHQLEIFSFCEKYFFDHENPLNVTKYSRYFTEGYDAFGLDEAQLEDLRDQVLARFEPTVPELGKLAYHFFATGKYEFGSIALMLLKKHRPRFDRGIYEEIRRCLDKGVENWAHADLIATKITPIFLELGIASMDDFKGWLDSESKWTRRVAAVTMLYQKNFLPAAELLEFIQPLMRDSARAVQQGVGWFLRELWKTSPREVEDFLFQNKETAPRLIVQYATEKMSKDKKKRFRRVVAEERMTHPARKNQPDQNRPHKPRNFQKPHKHYINKDKPRQEEPDE